MGIRFHCPNGHKLNVKAFLAGKKGVCPDCGVKLRIPERSEPGLEKGQEEDDDPAPFSQAAVTAALNAEAQQPVTGNSPSPLPAVSGPAPTAPVAGAMPAKPPIPAVPLTGLPYTHQPAAAPPMMPMAQPVARPVAGHAVPVPPPPPPPPPGSPPGVRDAIAESPLATWFVRPPSGGQFGPARGEVMRKWITEGRVTSDSLVWREGWTDWLAATEVFPSLNKPAAPLFSPSSATAKGTSTVPIRKKGGGLGVAILILLALICVILVVVLGVVLSGAFSST